METASNLALIFAIVALCAAAFNGWVFWLRRSQTVHLWLAVAAAGIAGMGVATALLYEAANAQQARLAQQLMLACSAPLILGFPRFTCSVLEVDCPRYLRAALAMALTTLVLSLAPDLYFSFEPLRHAADAPVVHLGARGLTPLGIVHSAAALILLIYQVALFVEHHARLATDSRLLLWMVALWFATAVNDMAVGMGLYPGPLLLTLGYAGFLMGFSGVLTRRIADSMAAIERGNEGLQALIESRTEELRQRELQLRHGEEMATIGTLAAGVAHDINTPLAFVTSNLGRLRELRAKPDESLEAREILADCRQGVEQIRAIVSDLQQLANRGSSQQERVDLCRVIESMLPMVAREALDRAQLRADLRPIPSVLGDPNQLGQVVLNLVLNALQAIEPGHPETNRVTLSTRFYESVVQLIVQDSGPGIPEEIRSRIFDPFFTTKASSGTGLGLAISHQIVARHRGQLTLESSRGGGTTATLSLPPHDPAQDAPLRSAAVR